MRAFKNSKIDSVGVFADSSVSMTPLSFDSALSLYCWVLTQRCQLHRWVLTKRCQWQRWVMALDHIQKLIFLDSVVSMTLPSFDSAVPLTPLRHDSAVPLTPLNHDTAVSLAIWNLYILANWLVFWNYFRMWIRGLGRDVWWKNRHSKISWDCPITVRLSLLDRNGVRTAGTIKTCTLFSLTAHFRIQLSSH